MGWSRIGVDTGTNTGESAGESCSDFLKVLKNAKRHEKAGETKTLGLRRIQPAFQILQFLCAIRQWSLGNSRDCGCEPD